MNWKVIGIAAIVVVVAAFLAKGNMSGPTATEKAPVTPTSAPAETGTVLSGDAEADIDAILAGEESADAAAIAALEQDSTLVANDSAALSDMTNAYDSTQY
jgi:hypothetical protein